LNVPYTTFEKGEINNGTAIRASLSIDKVPMPNSTRNICGASSIRNFGGASH